MVACSWAVRQPDLPASFAGSPVQPPPGGMEPFLMRSRAQAPLVLPLHTLDAALTVLKSVTLRPPLEPAVWQPEHFWERIGCTVAA